MDIEQIKRLKSLTGVGLTEAKRALQEAGGDFDKALEAMRVKGLAKADKKAEREARAGLIDAYVHSGRIGVLIEVNCETDFVARTEDFKTLVHDLAMQVAATAPLYVSRAAVPEEAADKELALIRAELKVQGQPADKIDDSARDKLAQWYSEVVLLEQSFIKEPGQTVEDRIKGAIAVLGENIVVRRFSRMELGETD